MIQQISMAVQIPQTVQNSQTNDASDAKNAGAFQSLLQAAATGRPAAEQPTDVAQNTSTDGKKPPKGEKDSVKDASGLPTSDAAQMLALQALPQQTKQEDTQPAVMELPQTKGTAQTQAAAFSGQNLPQQAEQPVPQQPPIQQQAVTTQPVVQQTAAQTNMAQKLPAKQAGSGPKQNISQAGAAEQILSKPVETGQTQDAVTAAAQMRQTQTQAEQPVQPQQADVAKTVTQAQTREPVRQTEQAGQAANAAAGANHLPNLYTDGKVVVKVSEAQGGAKTTPGSQVADAVVTGLKAGKQQLQVNLYPQSLGKVTVKLVSENGLLTVEIAASDPKTQSLLAASSGEIRSMLHTSTGQTVQVAAQEQGAQQYAQQQNNGSAQQQEARQQQEQAEQRHAQWYSAGNTAGVSTSDFLSILRQSI